MDSSSLIYLDYAAATPLDGEVLKIMQPYFSEVFYNPSATYLPAVEARKALENARSKVAYWLGAKTSEIIFTAGATEANNLAIHGVMRRFPDSKVLVSAIEHDSVLAPAKNYDYQLIEVTPDGRINLDDLDKKIDDKTVLVSIMHASNEIGTIEPLRDIATLIAKKRLERATSGLPLYLHSDAAQAGNYLDLHASRLGVDMMSLNGGKIYGPKQSGALYVNSRLKLKPLIDGGGQERGLRSGTENVAGSVGLAAALDKAQTIRSQEARRLKLLQESMISLLSDSLNGVEINGSLKYRLPNNLSVSIAGTDNERLLVELEQAGVLAAAGSACSASSKEASHVLKALGKTDTEARSTIRFSLGRQTTKEQIEKTISLLADICK